jgi:serine/threonine protein kinase
MVIFEFLTGLPPWYTRDTEVLFERIKEDPLVFPRYISPKAQSLIEALLNRNPKERLGSRGAQEVRAHPFFVSIDWLALMRRQTVPPFNPCQGKDVSMSTNFDAEFTSMPVHSLDDKYSTEGQMSSDTFSGFTFSGENADEK